jgi:spore germination cell wall hydrolase CwlJ-like protein
MQHIRKFLRRLVQRLLILALLIGGGMLWINYNLFPQKGWEQSASPLLALTTALYWEGAIAEPEIGLRAIAWVVFNREKSKNFPDTIRGVVSDGAAGKHNGGCQFSFNCDGYLEMPHVLCDIKKLPHRACDERWRKYLLLAAWLLFVDRGQDPTGGSSFYWTRPVLEG